MLSSLTLPSLAQNKILLIGDSLSAAYGLKQAQGWVDLLQNKYTEEKKPITIVNTAISGQTTGNALLSIDVWLKNHKPSHVIIELGGNDGIRGFPVKVLNNNLRTLIDKSLNTGATVALMQIQIMPNLGPRYTEMFSSTYAKAAKTTGVYLMPFFMTEIATDPNLMQDDNLHPNAKAQPIIRDYMHNEIDKWFEQITLTK